MSNAKAYTDSQATTSTIKTACKVVSTVNLSLNGTYPVIDQSVMTSGTSRLLLVAQTNPAQNGIYVYTAGNIARATDADTSGEMITNMLIEVTDGTILNRDSVWQLKTAEAITLGTTPLVFEQVYGNGAGYALQQRVTALEP